MTENSHHEVNATVPAVFHTGQPGRPRFQIEADSLKFLLEFGFKAIDIATMMSVSLRTIQRRMAAFHLREEVPRYTPLSNEDLDEMCREIIRSRIPELWYGGMCMTKFNNHELISNDPNCTCINPKLNNNEPILCSKP